MSTPIPFLTCGRYSNGWKTNRLFNGQYRSRGTQYGTIGGDLRYCNSAGHIQNRSNYRRRHGRRGQPGVLTSCFRNPFLLLSKSHLRRN